MTMQPLYRAQAVCSHCDRHLGTIGPVRESQREEAAANYQAFYAGVESECRLGEVRWALFDPSTVGGTVLEAWPVVGEGV